MNDASDLRQKHPCPFYGFYLSLLAGVMADQEGNQCALIVDSYDPCQMERGGETPDWETCSKNCDENKGALEALAESIAVFPKSPGGETPRKGVPLKDWQAGFVATD
jgi:hypothetical protein